MRFRRVCVFCGSSIGRDERHRAAARVLGALLAQRRIGLVYGGGSVGLMGIVADAVLAGGGDVQGVIPAALATTEIAHGGLTRLHVVESMHARKALMAELADAFLALPGGFGTYDELFEVTTWAQLGLHEKPIGLLNSGGYFDPLLALVARGIGEGFIRGAHRELMVCERDPASLLAAMELHAPKLPPKWRAEDDFEDA